MLDLKHTFIYFLVFLVLCVGLPLEKLEMGSNAKPAENNKNC